MSVVVYAESSNGLFKKGAAEILTYAYKTAKSLNMKCVAVTLGSTNELQQLSKYGIDKVVSINTDFDICDNKGIAEALSKVIEEESANIFILSNSNTGKTVGPRISVKLDASFISNAVEIPQSHNPLIVKKKSFSGKAFELAQSINEKVVIALSPNAFHIAENPNSDCEFSTFEIDKSNQNVNSSGIEKAQGKMSLAEAETVVSAGRGLKGPENWNMIEELADLLDAGTACSKPVSDIGWRPHSEHVGQTGKAIAPNLYIAIGISGAIQHLAGVNSSKIMVAINTDPDAPFFKAADYGIVGDAFEVVPRLIDEIKRFKSAN
ncbi:MAG: electron transfer flavoprotein subunit alpha/FixB family protein [Bacteroidota bacterium]|nr:electron transfer flavoprotein subunit alpha/FixB family protein [Bacteroidota bacterium]